MVKMRNGSSQTLILTDLGRQIPPNGQLVLSHEAAQASNGVKVCLGRNFLTIEYAEKPIVLGFEHVTPDTNLGPWLITAEGLRLAKEGIKGIIPDYDDLNVRNAAAALEGLSEADLLVVKEYEAATKNRKGVLKAVDECLLKLTA